MSKRAHESAFPYILPGGKLVFVHGSDDPQPQVQPISPSSPRALFVPGSWPLEQDYAVEEHAPADRPDAPISNSILYTVGKWALTTTIKLAFALPSRLANRYFKRQQIIVQPIARADGARKKRIIDAGLVDAPYTPTPSHTIRRRVGRGRSTYGPRSQVSRAPDVVPSHNATQPQDVNQSPNIIQSCDTIQPQDLLQASSDIRQLSTTHMASPILVSSPVQNAAYDNDVDMDDSIDWSWTNADSGTPLIGSPTMPAASPTEAAASPGTLDSSPIKSTASPVKTAALPKEPAASPIKTTAPEVTAAATPPSTMSQHARKITSTFSNIPDPIISPDSHFKILQRSSIAPIRKNLIRNQLTRLNERLVYQIASSADHTVPNPKPNTRQEPSELQKIIMKANALRAKVTAVAQNAQEANDQYKARAEARLNSFSARPTSNNHHDPWNTVPTVDQELSELSDAPSFVFEEADEDADGEDVDGPEISLYSPAPPTTVESKVRFSSHATLRPFYNDARVSDFMEETLLSVATSPVKPSERVARESATVTREADSSDQESTKSSPGRSNGSPAQSASTETIGFTGVPDSTWDASEDSILESEPSRELLDDIHQGMHQVTLGPTPTPSPPPAVKDLVSPLSAEERDVLDAVIKKTQNGLRADEEIIEYKLRVHDMRTLLPKDFQGDPRAWLNDTIVNEYLSILVSHEKKKAGYAWKKGGKPPPIHAFSSYFFSTLMSGSKGVDRWAAKVNLDGAKYLECDLILYPICYRGHWRLLAVKPKERLIEYLDSMKMPSDIFLEPFLLYLGRNLGDACKPEEWKYIKKQRSVQQINDKDCGVFTILNALTLIRDDDYSRVLPNDGMLEARERIAVTLLKGSVTTEFD
ncbi:hypothetical protein FB567DRAFT_522791 [Paraphoma chrysanthemicola]|uniref:Ubiquitin-like protease family profile domain-containing protein n=1 Tax=Paraphoma chrysanthemicola TaxID=798071 RepID=A0A8K0W0R7_9PLEO|nr:hypothetical protein FB567DRAFT_522791 [Paraphoma chrysanthemicola]